VWVSTSAPHLPSPFSALSLSLELVPVSLFLPGSDDLVLVTVVVTRIVLPSSISSTLICSLLWKKPSCPVFLGYVLAPVLEPKSLDREKKATKSGRIVAIDDATKPMPGSTVDQMDTSVLSHKKSSVLVNWWM
jgi:hypothetical protein